LLYIYIYLLFYNNNNNNNNNKVNAEEIVNTASVNFNVIINPEYINDPFCVSINDTIYNLSNQHNLLWKEAIDIEVNEKQLIKYYYCTCNGTIKEDFNRLMNITSGKSYNTPNEFFQRPTPKEVNFLPEIWENPYNTRDDDVFDINNVNTFYLTVENATQLELMNQFPHHDIKIRFTGDFYRYYKKKKKKKKKKKIKKIKKKKKKKKKKRKKKNFKILKSLYIYIYIYMYIISFISVLVNLSINI